jgi:hypothetical protein
MVAAVHRAGFQPRRAAKVSTREQPGNQSARHHGFHDASLKSVAKIRQDRSIIVQIQII